MRKRKVLLPWGDHMIHTVLLLKHTDQDPDGGTGSVPRCWLAAEVEGGISDVEHHTQQ